MFEMLQGSDSGELEQQDVVVMIQDEFGEKRYRTGDTGSAFLYQNANGRLSIDKKVLKEFRKLTRDTVVWERAGYWRKRKPSDRLEDGQNERADLLSRCVAVLV